MDQVRHHVFTDIQIDYPIHQVEANERDGEEDSRIFVDVRRRDPAHLLQVLLAVEHRRHLVQHQLIGVVPLLALLTLTSSTSSWQEPRCAAPPHHIGGGAPSQQGVMHINTYFLQSRRTKIRQTQSRVCLFVLCELLVFSSVIGLSHLGEFCNSFVKYGAFVQRILGTFLTGMKIEQQRTAPAHWRF